MIIQKKFHIVVGWLFVELGTLFVILTAIDLEITDVIRYPIWGAMSLLTAAAGILTFWEESVSQFAKCVGFEKNDICPQVFKSLLTSARLRQVCY